MIREGIYSETTRDYIIDGVMLDNLRLYLGVIRRKALELDALMAKGVLGGKDAYTATRRIAGLCVLSMEILDNAKEANNG